ncbi:MAG TPA: hypothetical protein VNJ09_11615 [Chthonomonadales bacterium]|nr:hypothetical protein [Chthonomonadales bacterium]
MRVHNLPEPVSASLYEEAVAIYLANAGRYIESCYWIGNTNFPGLSDLDLVVIPRDRWLAPQHLAIKRALPPQYHRIVLHDPYILPKSHLQVYRYASFGKGKLVYGPPLLANITEEDTKATHLCNQLESLYRKYHYLRYCKQRPSLNALLWIAVGSALRFPLQSMVACNLLPPCSYEEYKVTYDQMRARYLEAPCEKRFWQMFHYFETNLERVLDKVYEELDIDIRQVNSLHEFYSRESYSLPGLCREEILQREAAVWDYLRALRSRHFGYGSLFESSWRKSLPPTLGMRLAQWAKPALHRLRKTLPLAKPVSLWAACFALLEA